MRGWDVTVPTFRVDVSREVDLIEEVGRHHGYDRLPIDVSGAHHASAPSDPRIERDRLVRRVLLAAGCSEALTFSFIDAALAARFCRRRGDRGHRQSAVGAVFRPASVAAAGPAHVGRAQPPSRADDVRLFELGATMTRAGESRRVAVALTGERRIPLERRTPARGFLRRQRARRSASRKR